ncbi:hypothetical protein PM082_021821 [Marasmius tenuissimus]|nr:hypothetical protein PM082_021821 [Marasmius tenuissimus]
MKLPAVVSLFVASSLALPQFWTTNAESDAGTTTCVTWTFPDGSVTTYTAPYPGATQTTSSSSSSWTGGTSDNAIPLTTTRTVTVTTTPRTTTWTTSYATNSPKLMA